MRRCRVDPLPAPGATVSLDPTAAHHLTRVLRLGDGAEIELFDGNGAAARATLILGDDHVSARVEQHLERADLAEIHLILAVLKGPAMDLAVRMATEAGATHIHTVQAARSVPKGTKIARWERICVSASTQCQRPDVPRLLEPVKLHEALARTDHIADRRVCVPGAARAVPATDTVAVLIGPEGGWTDAEVEAAVQAGCTAMGLGRWVLRASTAAGVSIALAAPA